MTTSSDPRLGAIRMAWWRERLEQLDKGAEAPAEPRLQAVATELLPRGISGQELSRLEDAWLPLLEPFPWGGAQAEALKLRGRILFGLGAQLLGDMPTRKLKRRGFVVAGRWRAPLQRPPITRSAAG